MVRTGAWMTDPFAYTREGQPIWRRGGLAQIHSSTGSDGAHRPPHGARRADVLPALSHQ